MSDDTRINVVGIVSGRDSRPVVQFEIEGHEFQMEIADALLFARRVYESTWNAVYDAGVFNYFVNELEASPEEAANVINGVRIYRADHWGQPQMPGEP